MTLISPSAWLLARFAFSHYVRHRWRIQRNRHRKDHGRLHDRGVSEILGLHLGLLPSLLPKVALAKASVLRGWAALHVC